MDSGQFKILTQETLAPLKHLKDLEIIAKDLTEIKASIGQMTHDFRKLKDVLRILTMVVATGYLEGEPLERVKSRLDSL